MAEKIDPLAGIDLPYITADDVRHSDNQSSTAIPTQAPTVIPTQAPTPIPDPVTVTSNRPLTSKEKSIRYRQRRHDLLDGTLDGSLDVRDLPDADLARVLSHILSHEADSSVIRAMDREIQRRIRKILKISLRVMV